MDQRNRQIMSTLYGTEKIKSRFFLITPLQRIFDQIAKSFSVTDQSKGWWPRMAVKCNDGTVVEVWKVPMGGHILDSLKLLRYLRPKAVLMIGYCGSLIPSGRIGNIMLPDSGRRNKSVFSNKLSVAQECCAGLVEQLLLSENQYKKLRSLGCDCIDMETYYLYRWGQVHKIDVQSVLVVTDLPLTTPFYSVKSKGLRAVSNVQRRSIQVSVKILQDLKIP